MTVPTKRAADPSVLARLMAPLAIAILLVFRRPQRDCFYEPEPAPWSGRLDTSADANVFEKLTLRLAAQDWLLLGYLLTLLFEVFSAHGPRRSIALGCLVTDLVVFGGVLWIVRGGLLRSSFLSALAYRVGVLFGLLGSFLQLQWILPAASGPPLDASLRALDLRLFGVEPAEAWDRFVRPGTTEWFSFFYYGYFLIVAVHVLPALFFGRSQRFLVRFGFGFLWLYCVGHVVYTLVPAYGPYMLTFDHPLEGALWWPLVKQTVASVDGGARTDVFPSLHTAGPAFLAMFSFLERKRAPFRFTWLPLSFAASQIIVATMFLRWHYLIDIGAGLALAISGVVVGRIAYRWDEARVLAGGPNAWPGLELSRRRTSEAVAPRASGEPSRPAVARLRRR